MKRIVLCVLFFLPFLASAQSLNISWVDAIGGATGNEVVQSTVVDATGNVYIGGSFEGTVNFNPNGTVSNLTSVGLRDAFFAKYTTAGVLVWVKQLGAAAVDEVYALAVDGTNVYVAGYYNGTVNFNPGGTAANLTASGSNDIFYGKYLSSTGALVWANGHGNTGFDAAVAIKVDASGNVFVTGYFAGTVDFDPSNVVTNNKVAVGQEDIFLLKLSPAGAFGWVDTFGSTGSDVGLTVDVDNSNVYVGGSYKGTIDLDPDLINNSNTANVGGDDGFFGKYSSSTGALVWWATVRSTGDDQVNSIVLNGTNFYLGGIFSTSAADFYSNPSVVTKASNGGTDIFIAKYNGASTLPAVTWLNTIGGISDDRSNLLTIDASANVYSTGSFDGTVDFDPSSASNTDLGTNGLTDIYVASYSSGTGAIRFAKSAGSTSDEEGTTVAVDGSGNVYVGGYFQGTTSFDFNSSALDKSSLGSQDAFVAKYAQSAFAPEPTAQPTNLQVVDLQSTQFTYDITAAPGVSGGYLHIYKVGTAPTAFPVDGIEYSAGDVLSDGSIVKYSDAIAAGNFYGSLTAGTAYFIKIFSFNGSGIITNYLTTNPLSATITTINSPTITSFNPTGGSIGFTVTITGTGFSTTATNNLVKFNGTTATITGTPTTTSITAIVPAGATTGKITVEVGGQIATSVNNFTIPTGWITKASMTTPRWGSGIGNVGEVIYVAGGYIPGNHLTAVEAYTVSTNSWVAKASRPGVQTSPAYGVINSILYTAGGTNTSVEISDLWSYNSSSDAWTSKTPMPAVRQAACGGVINGQFYVVGGRVGSVSQSSMIVYDPTLNTWSTKTSMPTARYGAAVGVINGLLYVAGGISAENNTVFSTLEVYDPVANTWTAKAPMPTARYGAAYEVLNGMLYVIGGGNNAQTVVPTVEAYNPTSNTWSTIPSLTFARAYAAAIVSNGSIYVTGGHSNANTAVPAIEQYEVNPVTPTPTISGFNPASASIGVAVTITGTNFSTTAANNTVKFNGTTAIVTNSTATTITTTVPTGATTGLITVEVGGQTGTSSTPFTVTTVTLAAEPTAQPTNLVFSNQSNTGFDYVFTAASGSPAGYIVLRSSGSAVTGTPVDGTVYAIDDALGNAFVRSTTAVAGTIYSAGSLTASTAYHMAIFSFNGSGTSINYRQLTPLVGNTATTANPIVDTTPPVFGANTTPTSVKTGETIKVSITITDAGSGVTSAELDYGESTLIDWTVLDAPMSKVAGGNVWEATIPSNVVKDLGVEYLVTAYDAAGNSKSTDILGVAINVDQAGFTVPFAGAGTAQANYRIVSVPLALEAKTVDKVFGDDLGNYGDKSKWRMFRYSGGRTNELTGSSSINPGEGYWLISSENAIIDSGPGKTVGRISSPFTMSISQGFNQIGNPYVFNLLWADFKTYSDGTNDNTTLGLGDLKVYTGSFGAGTVLKKYEGGFVMATTAGTLVFPAEKKAAAGRIEDKPIVPIHNAIDGSDWEVNFELSNGIQTMNFSGIGMNKKASEGYDAFDDFTLPRFVDFIELNHASKELFNLSYTKDIVPSAENHTWEFTIESNANEQMTIKWDNSFFGKNDKQLVLWDVSQQRGFDMRTISQYIFNKSRSGHFKVFYGDENYIKEKTVVEQVVFHEVFPNPATDKVTISFSVPTEDRITIQVIDLLGRKVATIADGNFKPGYHEVSWNALDDAGNAVTNGIYITQIKSLNSDHQKRLSITK